MDERRCPRPHAPADETVQKLKASPCLNDRQLAGHIGFYFCQFVMGYPSVNPHILFVLELPREQTRGIHPMLFQCWTSVEDGGPALKQH